jgi:hypothetical protein
MTRGERRRSKKRLFADQLQPTARGRVLPGWTDQYLMLAMPDSIAAINIRCSVRVIFSVL